MTILQGYRDKMSKCRYLHIQTFCLINCQIQGIHRMTTWKRILIIYLSTSIIVALTYVSAVVIFEGGKELGQPMWGGFLIQLCLLSTFGLIYFGLFYLPILLLVEKYVTNYYKKMVSYSVATVLLITFAYIQYSGAGFFSSFSLSIFASLLLFVVQYLTMRSSSCFARDRNRAAPQL